MPASFVTRRSTKFLIFLIVPFFFRTHLTFTAFYINHNFTISLTFKKIKFEFSILNAFFSVFVKIEFELRGTQGTRQDYLTA